MTQDDGYEVIDRFREQVKIYRTMGRMWCKRSAAIKPSFHSRQAKMIRINQEQAVVFVQHALTRAVPNVTFGVAAHQAERGGPALKAEWTDTRSGETGTSVFPLPHPERGSWDAGSLVYAAVHHFTSPFGVPSPDERDRAA